MSLEDLSPELARLLCRIAREKPSLMSLFDQEGPDVLDKIATLESRGLIVKLSNGTLLPTTSGALIAHHVREIERILRGVRA